MGGFGTFCALCGGSLVGGRYEEDEDDEEDDDEEEWSSDIEDYSSSYDPLLVSQDSLAWLDESCCLGINPQAEGDARAFISGKAVDYDRGGVKVQLGSDSNQPPTETSLYCYRKQQLSGLLVFPFHNCCLDIFTQALTGVNNALKIDKDTLFDAMAALVNTHSACLALDYGSISGQEQYWESVPGEGFSVANPSPSPSITDLLEQRLATDSFQLQVDRLEITHEPRVQDPLATLPLEVLSNIFDFLSGTDLLELLKASWPAFCATRRNAFWRRFLIHDMPWLVELWLLLGNDEPQELDYKAVFGMDGTFMALANRRRIWAVCEQLAPHYYRHLQTRMRVLHAPEPNFLQAAISTHMISLSDEAEDNGSSSLQHAMFLYSEEEIRGQPVIYEVYWAESGYLIGLGAVVGKQRRIVGQDGAKVRNSTKTAVRVESNDLITHIKLLVATTDPNNGETQAALPKVVAIELGTKEIGKARMEQGWKFSPSAVLPCISATVLHVTDGATFVGLAGHIDQVLTLPAPQTPGLALLTMVLERYHTEHRASGNA
ncbi:hypothetical protein N658DRAFT_557267 [Parathielavia hyrcaniae]|uniref:F-box domain-containing protein n=1 Tax=Parathielavia hyrcaniae TaxID=113614 RepID=A0AAN6Q4E9_9PEZI|nr:hypothetical protein N658DRAFT_557267 [Parathielavia hyrcaniae]